MSPKLDKLLCKKYPKLFVNRHADMRTTCMCWGFDCGDGWFWLIDQLCGAIQHRIDHTSPKPSQVVVDQVKEKYGSLHFYFHGGDDEVNGMVRLAEYMSLHTCEHCGSTDPAKVGITTKGWIKVCCKDCISGVLNFDPKTYGWELIAADKKKAKKGKKGKKC